MNSFLAALLICALIVTFTGTALGVGCRRRPRGHHHAAQVAADPEAEAWTAPMRPGRSLTGWRLSHDPVIRRWIRRNESRLP